MRAVFADAVAWALVQAGAGYVVHRLPVSGLVHDTWLFRERRWERGGRFYVEVLQIRRWKHLIPDAGDFFAGGFDKARLVTHDPEHLSAHARETRRAELGHWLAMVPAPVFVAANPPVLAPCMALYAAAVNLPCIAAQRYNRLRLERVLRRLGASQKNQGRRATAENSLGRRRNACAPAGPPTRSPPAP